MSTVTVTNMNMLKGYSWLTCITKLVDVREHLNVCSTVQLPSKFLFGQLM